MKKTETKQGNVKGLKTLRARVTALEKSKQKLSRVAAARREAEQFSQAIISTASEGIVVYDREFRYLAWNPFMENLTGVPAANVLGKQALEVFPHLRQQGIDRLLERALAGETVSSPDVLYHVPPTGKSGWMVATYYPRRNAKGGIVGVVGMIHDITERKRAEEEIKSLARFPSENPFPVLRVDRDGTLLFANQASAALVREWGTRVGAAAPAGWRDLAADALASRSTKTIEFDAGGTTYSCLITPVPDSGYVNLYASDITETKRVQAATVRLAHQNEMILNSAGEGILGLDLQGNHTFVNPKAAEMLGYTAEELVGRQSHSTWHHACADGSPYHVEKCPIYAALKDGAIHRKTDEIFWRKDGTSFPTEFISTPIYEQGKVTGAVVAFVDITERMSAEEALKKSEEYARSIIDSSLDMIITVDNQRRIVEFNQAAQDTFGYTREQVLGKHINLLYADPVEGQELHRTTFERGKNVQQVLNKRKNGEVFASQISAAVLRDSKGELLGIIGVSRDITESKRAEEARRQAEEKYRTIFEHAVEGIFQSTSEGRFISANPALARMWGYASPEELIASITNIAEQVYLDPAQRAEFQRRLQEHGEVKGFEFQVRRKDGSTMWVSENARAVRDAAGALLYYEGTTEDITARKQAEDALLKFQLGIERSGEAIFLTDPDGTIKYVNPAFEKIYGYSKEEAIGKKPSLLKSGLLDNETYQHFWSKLLSKQVANGAITNRAKNGEFLTIESTANPILNDAGEIVGFIAIQRDVTERTRAQAEMLLEKARFQQLFENSPIGIAMLDADDRIQTINPAFQTIFQYTPEQVVGRFINDVIIPSASQAEASRLSSLALSGTAMQIETVRQRKDGTLVPVQVYGVPIVPNGKVMGLYGMYADITQAKQLESQLKREVEKLGALHQIDRALSTLDLPACLKIIVKETRALFASDLVAILLSEGDQLRLVAEEGLVSASKEIRIPLGSGISGWCSTHGESVLVADVTQDARYFAVDSRTRAEMAAPLSVQGACIGVLNVESSQVDAFTRADLDLLESLAARAAAAIHNARLHAAEREHRQFAETLRDVGIALTSQLDPNAVLDQLLDLVGGVVPYDSAALLLLEGNLVRCKRQRGYDKLGLAEWMQDFQVPLDGLASLRKIVESGQPYVISDTYTDPNWTVVEQSRHIRSWIGAPIHIRGTLIGFLALDKLEPGFYTDQMVERLVAFASQAGMALDNARLYAEQQQLAVMDSMTGLSNRRHFVAVAQRELVRASRLRSPFAVLMIDLDNFKQVNDTFGHSAGDQALQLVAKLLASHVRAIDVVARYGGDEFVMLLPDSSQRAAEQIAARLREGVRALRLAVPNGTIELDFSVGVAIATLAPEETLDSLLVRADADMYAVKQRGKALASAA